MQKENKRSLKNEVKEEGRRKMGGRWSVKKREIIAYAPVALLVLQYFKPHLTVIARREKRQRWGVEIQGDG